MRLSWEALDPARIPAGLSRLEPLRNRRAQESMLHYKTGRAGLPTRNDDARLMNELDNTGRFSRRNILAECRVHWDLSRTPCWLARVDRSGLIKRWHVVRLWEVHADRLKFDHRTILWSDPKGFMD
jgi:hypothetical protein